MGRGGEPIALFIGDYFARASKHSGAWMSSFRDQQKLDGEVLPIIVNVMNFARAGAGEACLLGMDEAHTLFHEFGHALHGMLSDVTYPLLAGTNVATDFVEFPSQLYEHWLERPETLRRFARHHETGEPMPEALIERLTAARRFNQGFATVEFTASALVDMELHLQGDPGAIDVAAFETRELAAIGMPAGDRAAPLRAALPAHLLRRRLFRGLLQLSLVGNPRRRRFRGVRGKRRRLRSRAGGKARALRLFRRQFSRARRRLPRLPRPRSRAGRAAAQARAGGGVICRRDRGRSGNATAVASGPGSLPNPFAGGISRRFAVPGNASSPNRGNPSRRARGAPRARWACSRALGSWDKRTPQDPDRNRLRLRDRPGDDRKRHNQSESELEHLLGVRAIEHQRTLVTRIRWLRRRDAQRNNS